MIKNNKNLLFKRGLQTLWVLLVLVSVIVWLPKTDRLLCEDYESVSRHISLNDNWNIRIDDTDYENVSLDDFKFDAVNKGTTIVMQRTLPDNWDISQGALRFHIRQSAVRIYIDNEQVYEYGYDRIQKGKTVGSGFQFINFPKEYEGKTIRIELYITEDRAFTKFDSIQVYEWENAYRSLLTENRIPMLLGSFLVVFGLSTILITMFALLFSRKYIRVFCISVFSICIGLWTLCYYNVMLVFSIPLYSVSLIEYMTLYLAPIPLLIYMYENVKNMKSRILKAVYWVLLIVQILFDVIILSLHTIDIVHCAAVLKYVQVLIILDLIYFLLVIIISLKSSKWVNRLYMIGILVIGVCIGYDLINYRLNRYLASSHIPLKGVSAIGILIFIFILITAFYINITEGMMKEKERDFLIKSAYTDELTHLYNRRYCSEHMKEMDSSNVSDYTVISFDLNNLKFVNDTYGHAKGDILIKSAAEVISQTFDKQGITARMGGDEFVAVLMTSEKKVINQLIEEMYQNIDRKNQEIQGLNLSIAYGYASNSEISENNIEKLYQIADNRMYQNKKQYKEKRKNGSDSGMEV